MAPKKNIDSEQAETVEEHFQIIMSDESFVNPKYKKITSADLPIWFDEHLFKKGQNYFHDNLLSLIQAYTTGLSTIMAIQPIAEVLMSTKNSSSACLAYERYFRTEMLIIDLHCGDIANANSKFYKAVNTIRYAHSMVSKKALSNNRDGIKLKHLAFGLYGLTAYTFLEPKYLGLTNTKEGREAYNHFWRVMGYLMEIPNKLNVCRKNENETTALCAKILNEYISNHLKNANSDFFYLIKAAIDGLKNIDPILDNDAFLLFLYEINSVPYHQSLSSYSKIMYWFRKGIFKSFNLPIIGVISRIFWNKIVRLLLWLGVNYPVFAWLKFGKRNSKLNLYPFSSI